LAQSNFAFSKAIAIFAAGLELFSHKKDNKYITNMKQKINYESPQAVSVETQLENSILQTSDMVYEPSVIFGPENVTEIIGGTDGASW
jgi:hypothetical protein